MESKGKNMREKVSLGAGTFLAMGAVDMFAHLGPTGLVVGGIAAYLASEHGPEIVGHIKGALPERSALGTKQEIVPSLHPAQRGPMKRSFSDRVFGRFPDAPADLEVVDAEDAYVGPEEESPSQHSELLFLTRGADLSVNDVIDAGVFVSGMKGSGKSEFAARLMEQIGRFPVAQIIYDLKGDFVSLARSEPPYLQNPVIMTRERQYSAETILSCNLQIVVDLRTWPDMEQRAQVIARLNTDLLRVSMENEKHFPWLVHLDEAQQFVGQTRPFLLSPATWQAAKQSTMNLGVLGRSYGAVLCLYTQCIAAIHKDVIRQQELRVFMKVSEKNDLDCYEDYIEKGVAPRHTFAGFRPGDAVMILPDGRQLMVRFERRQSQHNSHTPHLTDALRHDAQASRRVPAPILAVPVAVEQDVRTQGYRQYSVDARSNMEDIPVERVHQPQDVVPRYTAHSFPAPARPDSPVTASHTGRHLETVVEREMRLRNRRGTEEEDTPVQAPLPRVLDFMASAPAPSSEPKLTFSEYELERAEYEWKHGYGSIAKLKGRLESLTGKKVSWYYPRQLCEKLEELGRIQLNRPTRPVLPDERTNGVRR